MDWQRRNARPKLPVDEIREVAQGDVPPFQRGFESLRRHVLQTAHKTFRDIPELVGKCKVILVASFFMILLVASRIITQIPSILKEPLRPISPDAPETN